MLVNFSGEVFAIQPYGGISRYFVEMALALSKLSDVKVRFRAPIYSNRYLYDHRKAFNHRGLFNPFPHRVAFNLSESIAGYFDRVSKPQKNQILHESYFGFELLERTVGKKTATFYDMIYERFKPNRELTNYKQRTVDACQHCIAISESTKSDMVELMNVAPEKITVIHLAATYYEPLQSSRLKRLFSRDTRPYILWVGPRSWYKNFDRFAAAYASSSATRDSIRIVLAGGPKIKPKERETWKELGVNPDVISHIAPTDRELAWLYENAFFLAYTTLYEGFGIPPLEAMMHGCPVVAGNVGSVPEVVGDAAFSIDPMQVDSIANGIDKIIDSKSLRVDLANRGRQRASKFSWEKCASETLAVYNCLG